MGGFWGWGSTRRFVPISRLGDIHAIVTHGAVVVAGGTAQPRGRAGTGCTRCCGAPCSGSRCQGSSRCAVTPELSLPRDAAGTAGRKQERGRGAPASLTNRSCPAQGLRVLPPPAPQPGRAVPSWGTPRAAVPLPAGSACPPRCPVIGSIVTPCHPRGARAGSGGHGQRPGAACGVWQSEQTHSWGLRSGPFGALDAHAAPFPIPWAVTGTTSPGLGGAAPSTGQPARCPGPVSPRRSPELPGVAVPAPQGPYPSPSLLHTSDKDPLQRAPLAAPLRGQDLAVGAQHGVCCGTPCPACLSSSHILQELSGLPGPGLRRAAKACWFWLCPV